MICFSLLPSTKQILSPWAGMARWSPVPPAAAAAYKTLGGAGRGAQAAVRTVCILWGREWQSTLCTLLQSHTRQLTINVIRAWPAWCHVQCSSLNFIDNLLTLYLVMWPLKWHKYFCWKIGPTFKEKRYCLSTILHNNLLPATTAPLHTLYVASCIFHCIEIH